MSGPRLGALSNNRWSGGTLVHLDRSWLPLSENPDHHLPRNEPFSQEMHSKVSLSSRISNCQILNHGKSLSSPLFFLWNRYPPMVFWLWVRSDECFFFQTHILGLATVSLLESESEFAIVTQLAYTRTTIFTSIVYMLNVLRVRGGFRSRGCPRLRSEGVAYSTELTSISSMTNYLTFYI